jgi:hypothetical protein
MKTQIKKDMMVAMKNKDVVGRTVLRVLLGEIERNEQTPDGKIQLSDTEVVKIIKNLSDNIKESYTDENSDMCKEELAPLQKYIPQQLTRIQIEEIVDDIIVEQDLEGMKSMGIIMKHFSETYPTRYDGKLVSTIIKEVLI